MPKTTLENRFTYHQPHECQVVIYKAIRAKAKELGELIEGYCPTSTEMETALTRLDEAVMHANAAVARHGWMEGSITIGVEDRLMRGEKPQPSQDINHDRLSVMHCARGKSPALCLNGKRLPNHVITSYDIWGENGKHQAKVTAEFTVPHVEFEADPGASIHVSG